MHHQLVFIGNPAINPIIGDNAPQYQAASNGNYVFVIQKYLQIFVLLGFIVGSVIFFFMLLFGAIEYLTAGGEKEKTGNAAKRITNAIIGLAILFSLFAVVKIIKLIFGVDLLGLVVPVIGP